MHEVTLDISAAEEKHHSADKDQGQSGKGKQVTLALPSLGQSNTFRIDWLRRHLD
jgi:hypothetical protein